MGNLYKHFKGNVYRVKTWAYMHDDTDLKEPYVIYHYYHEGKIGLIDYIRKKSEFLEEVRPGVQRFSPIVKESGDAK